MNDNSMKPEIPFERWIAILKYRGMDTEALVVAQKRNLQTLVETSGMVARGMEELAARQAQIVREQVDRAVAAMPQPGRHKTLNDMATAGFDFQRQSVEAALSGFQQLTDLVWKTNRDAFDKINRSVLEGLQNFARSIPVPEAEAQSTVVLPAPPDEKKTMS